jgi:hypothetical protein
MSAQGKTDDTRTVRLQVNIRPSGSSEIGVIAYRLGMELAESEAHSKDEWAAVEPEARRQWKQKYPNTAWFEIRHAVHLGWNYARGARKAT